MGERPRWQEFPNAVSLGLIVLLLANYFGAFPDLDHLWHIRMGEQIVRTGELRTYDTFSYTIAGKQLHDFEWLYEVVLYEVWSYSGWGGIKFAKTLLVLAPLAIVMWHLWREGLRWPGLAAVLTVMVHVLAAGWNLRPLYCSTIGLLLTTSLLHDHCTGRRPLPAWLPLVLLIWANVHPAVIMGQALLVGALVWEGINCWVRLNPPLAGPAYRRLLLIGGLALAATFVSPDPLERLRYPFQPELAHPIFRIFTEMQPAWMFAFQTPFRVLTVYVVAVFVLYSLVRRFCEYRLWEVALLLVLGLLANTAYRSLMDWFLTLLLLGVPHLAALLANQLQRFPDGVLAQLLRSWQQLFQRPLFRWQPFWPGLALAVLAVWAIVPPLGRRVPNLWMDDTPVAAGEWLDAQGLHGNFFGCTTYGTYLIWRLPDRVRCYADTRGFFFPPRIIEDTQYVPQAVGDWQQRLDRILQDTDYLLLESTGGRGELWRTLRPFIDKPLYEDDFSVLISAAQTRTALERLRTTRPG